MSTPEPSSVPAAPVPPAGSAPSPNTATLRPLPAGRVWAAALLAAALAGLASWGVGEAVHPVFPYQKAPGAVGPGPESAGVVEYNRAAKSRNSALYYGQVGGLLGLTLGLAGGLARRSTRSASAFGVLGLVLGWAAGASATLAVMTVLNRYPASDPSDLVRASLSLCGIWGPIGLAGGLTLGLGLGRRDRVVAAALGGLVGALLGTGFYPILVSAFAPTKATFDVIGDSSTPRLIGTLVLALSTAVAAARGATTGPTAKKPRPVPPAAA